MLVVHDLVKDYGEDGQRVQALAGVSFKVAKGELVAIMGPSGSGKSTLLHILSFLDRPTGGSYSFSGRAMDSLSDQELARIRNREMGFVFQAFNLLSRSTVYENVELPLLYSDAPSIRRKGMVEQAVHAVGLDDKMFSEAGKLSGGQKQRVAIARALVCGPNIIFADEPTGNLDSQSGAVVMETLEKLNRAGCTVILVTHETYTAEFARRLIRLKDGRIESDEATKARRKTKADFFK